MSATDKKIIKNNNNKNKKLIQIFDLSFQIYSAKIIGICSDR